jgi:hypothetical protein
LRGEHSVEASTEAKRTRAAAGFSEAHTKPNEVTRDFSTIGPIAAVGRMDRHQTRHIAHTYVLEDDALDRVFGAAAAPGHVAVIFLALVQETATRGFWRTIF